MAAEHNNNIKILVIDDDPAVLQMVRGVLNRIGYDVYSAANGESGIELFRKENPVLILTDINMIEISGIDVLRTIKKESPATQVLVFSGVGTTDDIIEALRLGACDYLTKPFNLELFTHTVNRCVERSELIYERIYRQATLEEEVVERTAALTTTLYETVKALGRLTEMRDPYTAGHQNRVALLAGGMGRELGMTQSELEIINISGLLHDIGKVVVPVELLIKPSKLTNQEFQLIKSHPQAGYDIIKDIPFDKSLGKNISMIVQQHHEQINGTGYPQQLTGDETELESKILSVADIVEAMSSHRPYRPALDIGAAKKEITEKRGELYSPECVDVCLHLIEKNKNDNGQLFESLTELKNSNEK